MAIVAKRKNASSKTQILNIKTTTGILKEKKRVLNEKKCHNG